jgi:hypothetical protein
MQRTGRSANMLSRLSNGRISACLNLSELHQGHSRRIHNRRGTQLGHLRFEKFILTPSRPLWAASFVCMQTMERRRQSRNDVISRSPNCCLHLDLLRSEHYSLGKAGALEVECPGKEVTSEFSVLLLLPAGRAAEVPAPSLSLAILDAAKWARRAAKCWGTSIFLIRLIVAPIVLLLA